jgi:hypothetical protein
MENLFELPDPTVDEEGRMVLPLSMALMTAVKIVNECRTSFTTADEVSIGDWTDHPDLLKVRKWLGRCGHSEDELVVVYWLAHNVRSEWATLPKRTTTEHRELYERIQRLCIDLKQALEETNTVYYRAGGHGLRHASVRELLETREEAALRTVLDDPEAMYYFPTLEDLLERIGKAAKRLQDGGPIHAQPRKRGAERGYFVRRMADLLKHRYGDFPCEVLAAITTVAICEPTDRELVAKLLK